ncbi:MAG: SufD family Fe-S cluster assembly protein [Deltaproteobacteria bacterium]|nr:SufD family Fe-S cluster assembly protein [Deltaproteobacteria bacterium]MCX7952232.1 SufD family Fe-S cluster assembly protein [Deltaproteobacteria bacterium]
MAANISKIAREKVDQIHFDESWRRSKIDNFDYILQAEETQLAAKLYERESHLYFNFENLDALEASFLTRTRNIASRLDNLVNPAFEMLNASLEEETKSVDVICDKPSSCWINLVCSGTVNLLINIKVSANIFLKLRSTCLAGSRANLLLLLNQEAGAVRFNLESLMAEKNSEISVTFLAVASDNSFFDLCNRQQHIVGQTKSDVLLKLILKQAAHGVFWGLINVEEGAQQSDAYQLARAMLLSPESRADLIPNLNIGANNVRCTHGASYSTLNPSELFYLQSRGIEKNLAKRILTQGFLFDAGDRVLPEFFPAMEEFIIKSV